MALGVIFKRLTIVVLMLGVNACSSAGTEQEQQNRGKLSILHSIKLDNGRAIFTVTSHGCTQESDFKAQLNLNSQPPSLRIFRQKPDYCRRAPFSKKISLQVSDLGSKSGVNVINQVAPFSGKKVRKEP